MELCNHQWIYDRKSCCYVLKCKFCEKLTSAYGYEGKEELQIGDEVEFINNSETIIKKKK